MTLAHCGLKEDSGFKPAPVLTLSELSLHVGPLPLQVVQLSTTI